MMYLFIAIGLLIGSFLNVVIYRVPQGMSIAFPASHCPFCRAKVKPYDNIPVISYMLLKGKCRHCNEGISVKYPLIEVLTGVLFGLLYIRNGMTISMIFESIFASLLICVVFIDLENEIIPDSINLMIAIVGIAFILSTNHVEWNDAFYGALAGGGFLFLIALVGPMGGGDIKFMAATGIWLGLFPTFFALLIAFALGGVIGVLLILFKIKGRKDHIPFGPCLVIGVSLGYFFYLDLLILYFKLLV